MMDLEYNSLKVYQRLHRGRISEEEWQQRFMASKAALNIALASKNVPVAMAQIFTRLYTLRNQIIHGGATYNSQVNREQFKDACNLLNRLTPLIIAPMMSAPDQLWRERVLSGFRYITLEQKTRFLCQTV